MDDTNSESSLPDRIKASLRPPEKMRPILDKVWRNPEIIDKLISNNPFCLSKDELVLVGSKTLKKLL